MWKIKLLHASIWKFEGPPLAFLPSQELQEVLYTQTYKFIINFFMRQD